MNENALFRLLAENHDILLWESEASDQAKQLGLHYAGFGYWADNDDQTVARTVDNKLVKLSPGEQAELNNDADFDQTEPEEQPTYNAAGLSNAKSKMTAESAMKKLTTSALEYADISSDIANTTLIHQVAKAVVSTALTGQVPELAHQPNIVDVLSKDEVAALEHFLKAVIVGNPNSNLVKAINKFGKLKPAPQPKDEPVEEPAAEPEAPEAGKIDPKKAAEVADINYDLMSDGQQKYFNKLMQKVDAAETTVQLNYIRALLKKTGLMGGNEHEWNNWKQLLKYIKSVKPNLVKGAKNKGKIKNKKEVEPTEPAINTNNDEAVNFIAGAFDVLFPDTAYWSSLSEAKKKLLAMELKKAFDAKTQEEATAILNEVIPNEEQVSKIVALLPNTSATPEKPVEEPTPEKQPEPSTTPEPISDEDKEAYYMDWIQHLDPAHKSALSSIFYDWVGAGNNPYPVPVQGQILQAMLESMLTNSSFAISNLSKTGVIPLVAGNKLKNLVADYVKNNPTISFGSLATGQQPDEPAEEPTNPDITTPSSGLDPNDIDAFGKAYTDYKTGTPSSEQEPYTEPTVEPVTDEPSPEATDFLDKDTQNATAEIVTDLHSHFDDIAPKNKGKLVKNATIAVLSALKAPTFEETANILDTFAAKNNLGTDFSEQAKMLVFSALKKKQAGEPMSSQTVEPQESPEAQPESIGHAPMDILTKALSAGLMNISDFSKDQLATAQSSIQAALDVPSPDDAKKIVKDLAGSFGLTKDEYKALYAGVFKQRAEKSAVAPTDASFADVEVPAPAIKGVQKSLAGWAKGDPNKVVAWLKKTIAKEPNKKDGLGWQAAALVKYHGVAPADVADILPAAVQQSLKAQLPKTEDEKAEDWFVNYMKTNPKLSKDDAVKLSDALVTAAHTGDLSHLDDLVQFTDLTPMEVAGIKDMITASQTPPVSTVEPEPEEEPEEELPYSAVEKPFETIKVNADNASEYVQGFLSNIGTNWNTLGEDKQKILIDAVKNALNVPDEFGVIYHLSQLAKKGVLDQDTVDALTFDILGQKEDEGTLDKNPESYKNYLDPKFAVDEFLAKVPEFSGTLNNEQKAKLYAVAEQGLSMKGADGYAKSKALYQQELLGQLPGFNDQVFQTFRHSLMQYHDSLKLATQQISQKKAEYQAKIKAEKELQKALDALGKGDAKQQVDSLVTAAGMQNLAPSDVMKVKVAVMKALTAPTSQDMMDNLDAIKGSTAYGGYSDINAKSLYVSSAPHSSVELLKKLVASQYKLDQDQYHPGQEPTTHESPEIRTKRILRNWLKQSGFSIANFPANSHGEKAALVNGIKQAVATPDPKKVAAILNDLHTTTAITDQQLSALKKAVYAERQKPGSLTKEPLPNANIKQHGVGAPEPEKSSKPGSTGLQGNAEFKALVQKYGVPADKITTAHAAIATILATTNTHNKVMRSKILRHQLMNLGMDDAMAKNMANAVTRIAVKGGPLVNKAIEYVQANTNGGHGGKNTGPSHLVTNDVAKQALANIPAHYDQYGLAKNEWVPGEIVHVSPHFDWAETPEDDSANNEHSAKTQDAWRATNLSHEDNAKFTTAANAWQGGSQWVKSPNQRKAINHIMHKVIEGPPPMTTPLHGVIERGLTVEADNFADFISAFQLGKRVYLGPSGFSADSSVARGWGSASSSNVKVLLRIRPPKNGLIKAARLSYRNGGNSYNHEQEMVVGTNNATRVSKVVKHVTMSHSGIPGGVTYEITMDYDDSLNEAVQLPPTVANGFDVKLWKGLSRDTIKMLIKYLNGPQRLAPK
jgi:hypothetical protein